MSRLVDLLSSNDALVRPSADEEDLQSEDAAGSTSSEDADGEAFSDGEGAAGDVAHVEEEQDGQPSQKRQKSGDESVLEDAFHGDTTIEALPAQAIADHTNDTTMHDAPASEIDPDVTSPAAFLPEPEPKQQPQAEAASPTIDETQPTKKKKKNQYVTPRELQELFEAHTSAPGPRGAAASRATSTVASSPGPSTQSSFSYVPSRQAAAKAANRIKATVPAETKELVAAKQMERQALILNGYDDETIAAWDAANPGIKPLAIRQTGTSATKPKKPPAKKKNANTTLSPAVEETDYSALAAIGIMPTSPVRPTVATANTAEDPALYAANDSQISRSATGTKKKAAAKGSKAAKGAKGKASTARGKAKATGRASPNAAYAPDVGTSRSAAVVDPVWEPETSYAQYIPQQEVEEEEDDRLYCVCQTLYDEDRVMIACDHCDNWYHPDCVNIDDNLVQLVESFVCELCEHQTHKRTTYHTACAREDCMEATLALSKYCSDWCGITVVASRMELQEEKRNLNLGILWEAVSGLEKQQATIETISEDHNRQLVERTRIDGQRTAQQLSMLDTSLRTTEQQRSALERQLTYIEQRLRYLQRAIQRSEDLGTAYIAANPVASSKTKKSKSKTGQSSAASSDAPCGFDVRLVWDDKDFQAWVDTEAGRDLMNADANHGAEGAQDEDEEGLVCLNSRRKCDRHTGWQKTKEADYEVEKAGLAGRIDALQDKERHLRRSIEDLQDTIRWRQARDGRADIQPNGLVGAADMDVEITPYVETFEVPPTPGVALIGAQA